MIYYVYILCSKTNGTLYIGHKQLVYFETYEDVRDAIQREKCLKKWNRSWKLKLISRTNPDWKDLFESL